MAEVLADTRQRFAAAGFVDDPSLEARILIGGLLDLSATEMITGSTRLVAAGDQHRIEEAVARRLKREPVHRILGYREFYGLHLTLSSATLEPRPDTEVLVDCVLPRLQQIVAKKGKASVLDLGTGTGAIALALLKECPQAHAVLCDISGEALFIAERNAHINGIDSRAVMLESSWYDKVEGQFDIIVSNPPYIVSSVIGSLAPEVSGFDPLSALDGGTDGLDAYRSIADGALPHLREGGCLAVEIGYDQKESVTAVFLSVGFCLIDAAKDYGENDRVLVFERKLA